MKMPKESTYETTSPTGGSTPYPASPLRGGVRVLNPNLLDRFKKFQKTNQPDKQQSPIQQMKHGLTNRISLTLMHISSRTLQTWRTRGILQYSRIGRKRNLLPGIGSKTIVQSK